MNLKILSWRFARQNIKLGWKSLQPSLFYFLLIKVGNQSQSYYPQTNQKKGKGADTRQQRHQKSRRRHEKNCQRVDGWENPASRSFKTTFTAPCSDSTFGRASFRQNLLGRKSEKANSTKRTRPKIESSGFALRPTVRKSDGLTCL